eukprot:tig00020675_g12581.t1
MVRGSGEERPAKMAKTDAGDAKVGEEASAFASLADFTIDRLLGEDVEKKSHFVLAIAKPGSVVAEGARAILKINKQHFSEDELRGLVAAAGAAPLRACMLNDKYHEYLADCDPRLNRVKVRRGRVDSAASN